MTRSSVLLVIAMLGCGRIGFDLPGSAPDGGSSARDGSLLDGPDSAALFDCRIDHPSASFCDGFEGPMLESWGYDVITNGQVASTTTRAYRGVRALEAQVSSIAAYKEARWGTFLEVAPIIGGDVYVRAFYWVPSTTVFSEQASLLVIGNGEVPYPSTYIMFAPGQIVVSHDGGSTSTAGDIPRDQWVCVELHVAVHPTAGNAYVALNGTVVLLAAGVDTFVERGYTNLDLGIHYATSGQGAASVWVDEVIVDSSPIGCN